MHPTLDNIVNGNNKNFFLLAGPCAIEGEEIAFEIARKIKTLSDKLEIPFIFKGSYRKANRSLLDSFTGKSFTNLTKDWKGTKRSNSN